MAFGCCCQLEYTCHSLIEVYTYEPFGQMIDYTAYNISNGPVPPFNGTGGSGTFFNGDSFGMSPSVGEGYAWAEGACASDTRYFSVDCVWSRSGLDGSFAYYEVTGGWSVEWDQDDGRLNLRTQSNDTDGTYATYALSESGAVTNDYTAPTVDELPSDSGAYNQVWTTSITSTTIESSYTFDILDGDSVEHSCVWETTITLSDGKTLEDCADQAKLTLDSIFLNSLATTYESSESNWTGQLTSTSSLTIGEIIGGDFEGYHQVFAGPIRTSDGMQRIVVDIFEISGEYPTNTGGRGAGIGLGVLRQLLAPSNWSSGGSGGGSFNDYEYPYGFYFESKIRYQSLLEEGYGWCREDFEFNAPDTCDSGNASGNTDTDLTHKDPGGPYYEEADDMEYFWGIRKFCCPACIDCGPTINSCE